jgi:predicted RNase H-like HicB family nuclease
MEVTYDVVVEKSSDCWCAYVPDLPGCTASAATETEVIDAIRTSIEMYIESLHESGEPIPPPSQATYTKVTVAA